MWIFADPHASIFIQNQDAVIAKWNINQEENINCYLDGAIESNGQTSPTHVSCALPKLNHGDYLIKMSHQDSAPFQVYYFDQNANYLTKKFDNILGEINITAHINPADINSSYLKKDVSLKDLVLLIKYLSKLNMLKPITAQRIEHIINEAQTMERFNKKSALMLIKSLRGIMHLETNHIKGPNHINSLINNTFEEVINSYK